MAVSKRNPIPLAIAIVGLALFFYFGFSTTGENEDPGTSAPVADLDPLDPSHIDAVAMEAASDDDDSDNSEGTDEAEQIPAHILARLPKSLPAQEEQRLDLSGENPKTSQSPSGISSKLKSSNRLYDLTFDDVKFDLEPDEPFSTDRLTDEIRSIDGQKIKIRGYIRPSFSQRGLKNFVFVRDNKECCFGPNAAIYDCMLVKLKKQTTTDYTVRPVTVEGTFYLKPYQGPDGNTWAIYRMRNATVK